MNVWRLMAHHAEPETAIRWTRREDRIAIGWGSAGDVRQYKSPEEVSAGILRGWPDSHNAGVGGKNLWDFLHTIKIDDIVIVGNGKSRELVVQVTGDYEWADENSGPVFGGDYRHQRKFRLLPFNPDAVWKLAGGLGPGYGVRWTLVRCKDEITNADLKYKL